MKNILGLSILAAVVLNTAGCFVYERRAPARTVVVDPVPTTSSVVTVLPTGYSTRVYRGSTYYYYGDTYYRTAPGGYVTTSRPW